MAVLKIARLGTPILREVAAPVAPGSIRSPETQRVIGDMIETMRAYDGAGLAAPQIYVPRRIVVYEVTANPRYPRAPVISLAVLINPVVTVQGGEMEEDWEGCLSLPDLRGRVSRFTHLVVRAFDETGAAVHFDARGFRARVIQHECDHLDGKVFVDRMQTMDSLTFVDEFVKYQGREQGVPASS